MLGGFTRRRILYPLGPAAAFTMIWAIAGHAEAQLRGDDGIRLLCREQLSWCDRTEERLVGRAKRISDLVEKRQAPPRLHSAARGAGGADRAEPWFGQRRVRGYVPWVPHRPRPANQTRPALSGLGWSGMRGVSWRRLAVARYPYLGRSSQRQPCGRPLPDGIARRARRKVSILPHWGSRRRQPVRHSPHYGRGPSAHGF